MAKPRYERIAGLSWWWIVSVRADTHDLCKARSYRLYRGVRFQTSGVW